MNRLMKRRRMKQPDGFIYFITTVDVAPARVKIGFTKSEVVKRFKVVQSLSPVKLRLAGYYEGTMVTEKYVHSLYAHRRIHNEWFVLDDELCDFIVDICEPIYLGFEGSQ